MGVTDGRPDRINDSRATNTVNLRIGAAVTDNIWPTIPCIAIAHVPQALRIRFQTADTRSRSRGAMRPEFCISLSLIKDRGRREDRVRAAPAVSRAMCI